MVLRKSFFALMIIAMMSMLWVSVAAQTDTDPVFEPAECTFTVPLAANVECGFVIVPEDRAGDPEDTIRIAVARYPARSDTPMADPVIYLQGGPGGDIVELLANLYGVYIAPITATRDFIVFDQRGTGLSEPALNCPEDTAVTVASLAENLSIEEIATRSQAALAACRTRLENDLGVNTAAYTSAASAADIADIAAVFGYDTINLHGGSYGTRLAQTVMRDYPDLVRSAVLDGVLTVEANLFNRQATKTELALNELFSACAADAACNASYPDLETVFYETAAALTEDPQPVTITNPLNGERYDSQVRGADFIGAVFFGLQSSQLVPTLPQTIYAASEGDVSALSPILALPLLFAENINTGMFFSVNCHEEVFATTVEDLNADLDAIPELAEFARSAAYGDAKVVFDICADWGAAEFDPLEVEPVVSDIPTLILGGQFDPATPPEWNAEVAQNLSNAFSYELPGLGHAESIIGGCPLEIIQAFIDDPSTEPDTSCIDDMGVTFVAEGAVFDTIDFTLVEYSSDQFGFSGLAPEGWQDLGNGIFIEPTVQELGVIQQAAPLPADDLLNLLMGQLSLETPELADTYEANGLTWSLYQTDAQGLLSLDIALAEADGTAYLILVQTPIGQSAAYYDDLFLALINAYTPAE